MNKRIEKLLAEIDMSPSLFADAIGVQRATISHILSGRNNPSLDLVQKVLSRFPELNPDWILSGIGEMWRENRKQEPKSELSLPDKARSQPLQSKLFDENREKDEGSEEKPAQKQGDKETMRISHELPLQGSEKIMHRAKLSAEGQEPKSVIKVIVLYSDHTFEAFTEL